MLWRRPIFLFALPIVLGGVSLAALLTGTAGVDAQTPTSPCDSCHGNMSMTKTLPSGEKVALFVDDAAFAQSVHGGVLVCEACHQGYGAFPHPTRAAQDLAAYRASFRNTCEPCHSGPFADMEASVHASLKGRTVMCTDCHGAHEVKPAQAPALRATSLALCTDCHQDEQLMASYGKSTNVVTTYLQDFHGRTSVLLSKEGEDSFIEEAVCADCHGAHKVLRVDQAGSQVLKENLTQTCQKCHLGATPNFPDSWMAHYEPSPTKTPLVFLARTFYWIMIPFTIGGLLIHILVDVIHRVRRHGTPQKEPVR